MSESGATLNISDNSNEDVEQQDLQPRPRKRVESKESSCGDIAMLDKTEEFFQICDSEGKGFITSTDMRVKSAQKSFIDSQSSGRLHLSIFEHILPSQTSY